MLNSPDIADIEALIEGVADVASFDIAIERLGFRIRLRRDGPGSPRVIKIPAPIAGLLTGTCNASPPALGQYLNKNEIMAFVEIGLHQIAVRAPRSAVLVACLAKPDGQVSQGQLLFRMQTENSPTQGGHLS